MGLDFLPIKSIESALAHAEKELAKATEARLRAHTVEDEWHTEVSSLKSLLKIRQGRSGPITEADSTTEGSKAPQSPEESVIPKVEPAANIPAADVNRIKWMEAVVIASGARGMTAPEIKAQADKAGITMHPNYPYTALRTLVTGGRLIKRGLRYFKEGQTNLALTG